MYQKTFILGNLGSEPEMRYINQGDAVCNFRVAVNRRWTNQDGQPGEETTWFQIETWGKLAESCNQHLTSGRQVFIEGRLRPDSETGGPAIWEDRSGQARASFVLRAIAVQFLGQSHSDTDDAASEAVAEEDMPF